MPITLGAVTFDDTHTDAREFYDEVGGRDERRVVLAGLVTGKSTVADIEAELDAIMDAASVEDYSTELSLRPGRRLLVRRREYSRETSAESLVGSFKLELDAKDPFEESTTLTTINWSITASGQTQNATAAGNVYAKPTLALTATGDVINPSFSDGVRTITYSGTVADGEELVFDTDTGVVTLDGVDVTPYTTGLLPQIAPEGTTLAYTDDDASSHTASVVITYRDRWW